MDFPLPPLVKGSSRSNSSAGWCGRGMPSSRGQGLAEVMSDKATMEVPAPFAGTISALDATPGKKVKVGELFLRYEPVGDVAATPSAGSTRERGPRPASE